MFKKNIYRVAILLITAFIASLLLLTSFYLNLFKNESSNFLLSKLNLVSIDYKYIQGNLITGFSIHDVAIESHKYSFTADLARFSININDIINNFEDIDFIKIENSKLFLKDQYFDTSNIEIDNSVYFDVDMFSELPFRDISLNNFDIINGDNEIYFKHLKLSSYPDHLIYNLQAYTINGNLLNYPFSMNHINGELSSLNNNVYFNDFKITNDEDYLFFKNLDLKFQLPNFTSSINVNGDGYTYLYGYNLNIDSLKVFKPKTEKNYKYSISLGAYTDEYFSFSNISSSDFLAIENTWNFRINDFTLLNENFDDIKGLVRHVEDSIYVSIPYNEKDRLRNKLNKSVLGADLVFYKNIVDINSLIMKIGNFKPLQLKKPTICSIQNDSFSGDNIYLTYKSGELLVKSFTFKNTDHYDFSLYFNDFDLDLFRGLNVGGILSGNLRITDEENDNAPFYATFSNAKVENLSNNAITMDKVGLEGSISNNEVEIISIDMEKKIGPLNVSGSFSSLDNFYDKIVDNLKIKIK